MSWTDASDIRAQLRRLWQRGELLRAVEDNSGFPLRLRLKPPTSRELTEQFEAARNWLGALAQIPGLRIEWRELQHRVQGGQRLPESIWIDSLDAALALIGERDAARRFASLIERTRATQPRLLDWLRRHPLRALELGASWPRLLDVVAWMAAHPCPGVHVRQVDVPGVHSKFIEAHRAVLADLFDLVLPPSAILDEYSGVQRFAARYGFCDKPARIRFRVLDPLIRLLPGPRCPDLALDAASFARLECPARRAFITENETNFLAFPEIADAVVIFGAGYGWDALSRATWLDRCELHYWGDIDTHGFAILDQLRAHFPEVESLLMDLDTLQDHRAFWDQEPGPVTHELARLNPDERALFHALRANTYGDRLRLEQERIGFSHVQAALARLG